MLKVGTILKCRNVDEMLDTMYDLESQGYKTDFVLRKDGQKVFWLEIVDDWGKADDVEQIQK